ncbi:MAG: phosphotransferase enzyme family protein, partial [Ignavibacteriales bacterium]
MLSINHLEKLFKKWSGEKVKSFSPLPESGSSRKYFRITINSKSAIGVYNTDKRENRAFIYLTKQFLSLKLNVPKFYSQDLENNIYLIEDLG